MSLLAALLIATVARVESVALGRGSEGSRVRLALSDGPGPVAVQREGDVARVSLPGAHLGVLFAGGRRFRWTPADAGAEQPRAGRLSGLELLADESGLLLELKLPAATGLELRREAGALWLVLHDAPARRPATATVAFAALARDEPPDPAAAKPREPQAEPATPATRPARGTPEPAGSEPPAQSDDVAGLARGLFPAGAGTSPASDAEAGGVAELYPRLFPEGPPAPEAEPEVADAPEAPGVPLGPFRLRASLDARYVDADTFLGTTPTRDHFLEVGPQLNAEAPLARGRFALDYKPVLRAFATYDRINSTSQLAGASLELPVGGALTLRAADRFAAGTLDTRLVDPGGEYFYELGRFHRNDLEGGARVRLGPRLDLDLAGSTGRVRFVEPSSFFDYDARAVSAGLGFELLPGLRSSLSYTYDTIPRPAQRPQAEAQSHGLGLTLDGELRPLLTGQLSLGYRSQRNPAAGEGGRSYSGLVASGVLTQRLGNQALVSLHLSRSTPPSAFEANGFYVSSAVQASTELPLPLELQLRGGLGWRWSSYRTVAAGLGEQRRDRLLGWYVALRRALPRRLALSGSYRVENRDSNSDGFDTQSDGFVLQLEWDALGGSGR